MDVEDRCERIDGMNVRMNGKKIKKIILHTLQADTYYL
jgi:hypothetical protein